MAPLALIFWIFIAPFIAARLTAVQIVIWMTLLPYLFLPEAYSINLPGLPDIDKTAAITIGLVLSYIMNRSKFADFQHPKTRVGLIKWAVLGCITLMIVGTAMTISTNPEPLFYGPVVLRGLRTWDGIALLSSILFYTAPFFFALRYLAPSTAHHELLRAFVSMGLIYSILMLIEVRLSPQLHTWVYGYFQHSFLQHIRGGYRPIVFLQHGIWVGFFIFSCVVASAALWKSTKERKWLFATLWLFCILVLSKNMAATLICILCVGTMLLAGRRLQVIFAVGIAAIVLFYPAVRQANFIPVERVTNLAASVSADRAQSFQYRLNNEDHLLARASQKPLFGWGNFNREKIFNQRGARLSVPDGLWIIIIGTRGWVGYIALFGLLTAPVFLFWLCRPKQIPPPETMALLMIIMGNLIYLVPNATLTAVGWLAFGGLAGYVRYHSQSTQAADSKTVEDTTEITRDHGPVYTRFPQIK